MLSYPNDWLQHAIVTVPLTPDVATRFAQDLPQAVPGLFLREATWTLSGQPPVACGDLSDGLWSWRVILDPKGLPPTLAQFVGSLRASEGARQALSRLGLAATIFLVDGPPDADPLDELSALCCLIFGLVSLGGSAVLFPEGMRAFTPGELTFDPEQLSAADVGFFVGSEPGDDTGEGRWVRTLGMEQFRLPDLACRVSYGPRELEQLDAARVLFESMVRHLVEIRTRPPVGETFDLGPRTWRVAPEEALPGLLAFERLA